jgi:branched-chain amino acid transport system permease protein
LAQQLLNAITLGSIYMLFAIGLSLSWGILNILNLAHGAILMAGALSVYWVAKDVGDLPFVVMLPLAMIICGSIAVLLERIAFRPIRRRVADLHASELAMLIASVGAASIIVAIGEKETANAVVSVGPDVFTVTSTTIFGLRITNIEIIVVILAIGLSALLAWFVKSTRHGRALRALAVDPYMSGLLGVSPDRMAGLTMFVSGAIAGAAGVLLAIQLDGFDAHMGDSLLLKAFAVIILGGVGSIAGAVAGAYLLAFIETMMIAYVAGGLQDGVAFALIIVLLLLRPQGLFSRGSWQRA